MDDRIKVLLATDGSEPSVRAAEFITRIVQPQAADVRIVVVLSYAEDPYEEGREDPTVLASRLKRARDAQDCASADAVAVLRAAGHEARVVRRFGFPSDGVVQEIDHWDPDLVVLGRRGLRGAARWLGSVSEHVLHRAKVPVLLVP